MQGYSSPGTHLSHRHVQRQRNGIAPMNQGGVVRHEADAILCFAFDRWFLSPSRVAAAREGIRVLRSEKEKPL
jgi:hypothetical protein